MGQSTGTGVGQVVARSFRQSAALALLPALAACATCPPPVPRPVMVKVPIATPIYCSPPELARPALPIVALTAGSDPAETVRAYAESVAILKGAVTQRDELLDGCRPPASAKMAAAR
jgi:hypothetical protein